MAPSPFLAALAKASTSRKGCPANVVFLGLPSSSATSLVDALGCREGLPSPNRRSPIQEVEIGRLNGAKAFFTLASNLSISDTSSFDALRSHLLRRRPASAIVYVRGADVMADEAPFVARLEAALGKSLWRNALCVTLVHPGHTPAEGGVVLALRLPHQEGATRPAACLWDGSATATEVLAGMLAGLVTTTVPFLPEPSPALGGASTRAGAPAPQPGVAQAHFSDLDLVCSNNLALSAACKPTEALSTLPQPEAEAVNVMTSSPGEDQTAPEEEPPSVAVPSSCAEQALAGAPLVSDLVVPAATFVPAFASLSLAFAPPPVLHVPSLHAKPRGTPSGAEASTSLALRGLAPVSASLPSLGASNAARLALPGASMALQSPSTIRLPGSVTAFPDMLRLPSRGSTFSTPQSVGGARRVVMVWFRNDLRAHDNEALSAADRDGVAMLPVYCFDPRDYGKSSSGFDRTGPYRAQFILQCVADLRQRLRARASDLVVRVGRPEEELPALARAVGAKALYAHREVTREDSALETHVAARLKDEGVDTTYFWGSTLYHLDDLPFSLDDMPCNYGGFREAVKALQVRPTLETPQRLKPMPAEGGVSPGNIPTLAQLGLSAPSSVGAEEMRSPALKGGEAEALSRLSSFLSEAVRVPVRSRAPAGGAPAGAGGTAVGGTTSTIAPCMLGASFSCKISPWLATGCLSPRRMFEEMRAVLPSTTCAGASPASSSPASEGLAVSLDWLVFELLWRDFFRFITKKHSSSRKETSSTPAPVAV